MPGTITNFVAAAVGYEIAAHYVRPRIGPAAHRVRAGRRAGRGNAHGIAALSHETGFWPAWHVDELDGQAALESFSWPRRTIHDGNGLRQRRENGGSRAIRKMAGSDEV